MASVFVLLTLLSLVLVVLGGQPKNSKRDIRLLMRHLRAAHERNNARDKGVSRARKPEIRTAGVTDDLSTNVPDDDWFPVDPEDVDYANLWDQDYVNYWNSIAKNDWATAALEGQTAAVPGGWATAVPYDYYEEYEEVGEGVVRERLATVVPGGWASAVPYNYYEEYEEVGQGVVRGSLATAVPYNYWGDDGSENLASISPNDRRTPETRPIFANAPRYNDGLQASASTVPEIWYNGEDGGPIEPNNFATAALEENWQSAGPGDWSNVEPNDDLSTAAP